VPRALPGSQGIVEKKREGRGRCKAPEEASFLPAHLFFEGGPLLPALGQGTPLLLVENHLKKEREKEGEGGARERECEWRPGSPQ
jgi:hypothetical protein